MFVPRFVTHSPGLQISSGMLATFNLIKDIVVELIRSRHRCLIFFIYVTSLVMELKLQSVNSVESRTKDG